MSDSHGPLLTPNQITVIRFIALFPLFAAWFLVTDPFWRSWIAFLFAIIFIADNWDGVVARRYHMKSTLGAYFDPIVDHITYFGLCIMFIEAGLLSLWFLFVLITRDLLVVFVKQYAGAKNHIISASNFAQIKADIISVPLTAVYFTAILPEPYPILVVIAMGLYLLSLPLWYDPGAEHTKATRISVVVMTLLFLLQPNDMTLGHWYEIVYMGVTLLFTIGSGIDYFLSNRKLFFPEKNSEKNDKLSKTNNEK